MSGASSGDADPEVRPPTAADLAAYTQDVPGTGWYQDWSKLAQQQWSSWCKRNGWSQVPQAPWTWAGAHCACSSWVGLARIELAPDPSNL